MVELLERRDSLEAFAAFHMAGHWDADGSQMSESIQRVVVRHPAERRGAALFLGGPLSLASPFVTTFREMREMRYLWRTPYLWITPVDRSVGKRTPHTSGRGGGGNADRPGLNRSDPHALWCDAIRRVASHRILAQRKNEGDRPDWGSLSAQDRPLSRLSYVVEKPTPIFDSCRWPGYPSELAATPTTDAINASTHCLLLLRPTLGNYFCRPRIKVRFSCHCLARQRRLAVSLAPRRGSLRTRCIHYGASQQFIRVGFTVSRTSSFNFCSICGATVHYMTEGREEHIAIPVGFYPSPSFPGPTVSVYEERMHSWVQMPKHIEHME